MKDVSYIKRKGLTCCENHCFSIPVVKIPFAESRKKEQIMKESILLCCCESNTMSYQRINCEYKIDESGSEKKREKRKKKKNSTKGREGKHDKAVDIEGKSCFLISILNSVRIQAEY